MSMQQKPHHILSLCLSNLWSRYMPLLHLVTLCRARPFRRHSTTQASHSLPQITVPIFFVNCFFFFFFGVAGLYPVLKRSSRSVSHFTCERMFLFLKPFCTSSGETVGLPSTFLSHLISKYSWHRQLKAENCMSFNQFISWVVTARQVFNLFSPRKKWKRLLCEGAIEF